MALCRALPAKKVMSWASARTPKSDRDLGMETPSRGARPIFNIAEEGNDVDETKPMYLNLLCVRCARLTTCLEDLNPLKGPGVQSTRGTGLLNLVYPGPFRRAVLAPLH